MTEQARVWVYYFTPIWLLSFFFYEFAPSWLQVQVLYSVQDFAQVLARVLPSLKYFLYHVQVLLDAAVHSSSTVLNSRLGPSINRCQNLILFENYYQVASTPVPSTWYKYVVAEMRSPSISGTNRTSISYSYKDRIHVLFFSLVVCCSFAFFFIIFPPLSPISWHSFIYRIKN